MLYPEITVKKAKKTVREKLIYVKESAIILLQAFSSYNAFILFLEQKFHF